MIVVAVMVVALMTPLPAWAAASADCKQLASDTSECAGGGTPETAVINGFSASTAGTDVEYVEIHGAPDTDYSNLTVLQIEGDSSSGRFGTVISEHAVGTTDADGFYVMSLSANTLQNGTLSLLLIDGWTGSTDVAGDLGTVVDSVGVNDGDTGDTTWAQTELDALFDGDDNTFPPGGASRITDGADTDSVDDWVRNDFNLAVINGSDPAPGEHYNALDTTNRPVEVVEPDLLKCAADTTPIGVVQGPGVESGMVGDTVVIEGIVVGDFQSGGFDGYYLQDAGDGDPGTSDGVFVFDDFIDVPVNKGDRVRVQGEVGEYSGMTRVTADTAIVFATNQTLPEPVEVTLPVDDYEALEGMYVTLPQPLVILEHYDYDQFGEVVVGKQRQYQPTQLYEPGSPEALELAEANATNRITIDDGRSFQNPDPAIHLNGQEFTLDNLFRGGDLVANATGVIDWRWNLWRLQPTQDADFTAANPRPAAPTFDGNLTVASFNVLNYFTTIDDGKNVCPDPSVGLDADCRGADTVEEFQRQQAKIVTALAELDADIVGLMEIENNDTAVGDLVDALNARLGTGVYAMIDTGPVGTDAIKVGMIYKTESVNPNGDFAVLDASVDTRFNDDKNRPAVAQTFTHAGSSTDLTVVVNHLKSKGSSCSGIGDPADPNGQGNCNQVRTAAAAALADWMASYPTGVDTNNGLIIGDLNAYAMEDPVATLEAAGWTNLVALAGGLTEYSFVFDGQLGTLDYALANSALIDQVLDTVVWHSNTDEPDLIDYDTTYKRNGQDALWAADAYRA